MKLVLNKIKPILMKLKLCYELTGLRASFDMRNDEYLKLKPFQTSILHVSNALETKDIIGF